MRFHVYARAVSGDVLIRQLEYLVALARERHFARAAATCHASQPALSAGIRKLETELGVTIVLRGHRFEGFTSEGQRVVGWAHRILAERDALRTDLSRMREGLTATLRIGAIPTAVPATSLVTAAFTERHPHASLRVRETSSRKIIRGLVEFDLDVGLTYLNPDIPSGLRGYPLYTERYLLVTQADGPLAGRSTLGWAEAASTAMCTLNRDMQNRRILDRTVAAAGAALRPIVEADTVGSLYTHVSTGRWSTIIPHAWLYAFGVPNGMCAVPLQPQPHTPPVGILVRSDGHAVPIVAGALLESVQDLDVAATLDQALAHAHG